MGTIEPEDPDGEKDGIYKNCWLRLKIINSLEVVNRNKNPGSWKPGLV